MSAYAISKTVDMPIEDAVTMVTEKLSAIGFGLLGTINMQEKWKEKLGKDTAKHIVLLACSPKHSYDMALADPNITVLFPCNISIREEDGGSVVSCMKPAEVYGICDNDTIDRIAADAEAILEEMISEL